MGVVVLLSNVDVIHHKHALAPSLTRGEGTVTAERAAQTYHRGAAIAAQQVAREGKTDLRGQET